MIHAAGLRRTAAVTVSMLTLLIVSTAPAAAASNPWTTTTQAGRTAEAGTGECTPIGDGWLSCTETYLSVFSGTQTESGGPRQQVEIACAGIYTYEFNPESGEGSDGVMEDGCSPVSPGDLTFGRKLSSVDLLPTPVMVHQYACDDSGCVPTSSRSVTVAASWVGFGPVYSSRGRSVFEGDGCRYDDRGKGQAREATFAGAISGDVVEGWGSIHQGRFTSRSRCAAA